MSLSASLVEPSDAGTTWTIRPRVLTLARSYPNGVFPELGLWTERPTRRIAEHCDVHVISPVPYCPPLPARGPMREYTRFRSIARRDSRDGVEVYRPRFVVGPGSSLYRFEARAYLRGIASVAERIHEEHPVDLVHAHFVYPDELARRWDVPLVVTEHAPWTGWLERPGVRGPALAAAEYATRIIAVSSYVRETIVEYTGDGTRVDVIPNGVDGSLYRPNADARDENLILYVGVINFNKGIDVLLEAMPDVIGRRSDARVELVGGSFYRDTRLQQEELEARASALGLGGRVSFVGHLSPREVAERMAASAVLVLPSRAESFGSVLIEALACGTPVVATRCGGPEDIVHPAVGKLVPKENAGALADALVEVMEDRDAYPSEALREDALRRFGWDVVVRRTLGAYQEVMAE
jgi:glycosyltransferase involved in cell wall biosynthesis